MHFSSLRIFQWLFVVAFVAAIAGLTYDFDSEAGKTMNAPVADRTTQSLLGYWKMDEGTGTSTTADSSGNANNLTMTAMEEGDWVAGNIGAYALDFDGSAEWLTVADPASGVLDIVDGADFSIVGWFNRDTFAGDDTIVAKKNDQTTSQGYVVWVDNGASSDYLTFQISDGSDTYTAAGATDVSATGWHHFAAVWNDGTGMYVYLDGKLDGSTTTSTASINSLANALAFRIGAESDNGVPFDGRIDDVKLYSKALSPNEVQKLSQTTVPVTPASTAGLGNGLMGHWTFDGPDVIWGDTANEIKDLSGKGNHGDASGLTAFSAVIGKVGQGMGFDGTDDYISAPLNLSSTPTVTVSFWLWADAWVNDDVAIGHDNGSGRYFYITPSVSAGTCDAGNTHLAMKTGAIDNVKCYENPPSVSMWHHWVGVFDATQPADDEVKFYLDGTFQADSFRSTGNNTNSFENATLYVMSSGGAGEYLAGKMDDLRIYNRVLSASEILNLYNLGR